MASSTSAWLRRPDVPPVRRGVVDMRKKRCLFLSFRCQSCNDTGIRRDLGTQRAKNYQYRLHPGQGPVPLFFYPPLGTEPTLTDQPFEALLHPPRGCQSLHRSSFNMHPAPGVELRLNLE
ncbi:hypothetical protein EYF80_020966 [Liparis tanakae]|uniref:Uncharacterized protein n=1 Tax=Liparis tanakae TaxID=230148 RepID=A0A4Z2HSN9_9TELE|nr:hypothetical protein EYF80_020966 [Liparis tanakae]